MPEEKMKCLQQKLTAKKVVNDEEEMLQGLLE